MKNLLFQLILFVSTLNILPMIAQNKNFYDFVVKDIDGNDFDFAQLKGKKVMIVNVASQCGLTPQYQQLQELYEHYKDKNFIIIAFPANNFANQEPGSNNEIKAFCKKNYGVTFPVMSKISVKGPDMHPLYKWLTQKSLNGKSDNEVQWNFQKYLIDENGQWVMMIPPQTSPMDEKILQWLEQ
jgi:glutathione peroxidase